MPSLPDAGSSDRGFSGSPNMPGEDSDFDLCLIKPTSVSRGVMDREAVPDFRGHFCAIDIGQRLPAMDVEIVHYQVNGLRIRIFQRQSDDNLSELKSRTVRCREGEMPTRFRLYCAEHIGSAATLIFVIPPRFPSRYRRPSWPQVGVQGDRLLV